MDCVSEWQQATGNISERATKRRQTLAFSARHHCYRGPLGGAFANASERTLVRRLGGGVGSSVWIWKRCKPLSGFSSRVQPPTFLLLFWTVQQVCRHSPSFWSFCRVYKVKRSR